LKDGRIEADGASTEVVSAYLSSGLGGRSSWRNLSPDGSADRALRLTAAKVVSADEAPTSVVEFTSPFKIEVEYEILRPLKDPTIIMRIIDSIGQIIWTSYDTDPDRWNSGLVRESGRYRSVCGIPAHILPPGPYRVDLGARNPAEQYCVHEGALAFDISEVGYKRPPGRRGVIAPLLDWETQRIDEGQTGRMVSDLLGARGTHL
jgi:hypothetical protein